MFSIFFKLKYVKLLFSQHGVDAVHTLKMQRLAALNEEIARLQKELTDEETEAI